MIMIASSDVLHNHLWLPSGTAVNYKLLVLDFDSKGSDPSNKDKVNRQLIVSAFHDLPHVASEL